MATRIAPIAALVAVAALVIGGCGGSTSGGGSFVVDPTGGVFKVNGIIMQFPPGAVGAPVTIIVAPLAPLSSTPLPVAAPTGMTAIAAVQLEPAALAFAAQVIVTFPLAQARTAGENLTLWVAQGSSWINSGHIAVVSAGGATAVTQIDRLGIYALFVPSG
jgi:hypothetical protein